MGTETIDKSLVSLYGDPMLALYLERPPSAPAARASFQRLLKDPPLRGSMEEVASCLDDDYYAQRVIQLIS